MANYRGGRINEEVRKEVSDIIRNNIKAEKTDYNL